MKNKLVAVCGQKYEPDWMVDELRENLSWVDELIVLNCKDRTEELWIHEGDYRLQLREMARAAGAKWLLITSPDERFEKNAGETIRPLIDHNWENKIYEFELKELFHPMWYRCDGVWDTKYRQRLYPLKDDQIMKYQPIQCPGIPMGDYEVVHLPIMIYHLKMIEKENRRLRKEVFNSLDPEKKYQTMGYDYLDDEVNAAMRRIDAGREYYPPYTKKYTFNPYPEKTK